MQSSYLLSPGIRLSTDSFKAWTNTRAGVFWTTWAFCPTINHKTLHSHKNVVPHFSLRPSFWAAAAALSSALLAAAAALTSCSTHPGQHCTTQKCIPVDLRLSVLRCTHYQDTQTWRSWKLGFAAAFSSFQLQITGKLLENQGSEWAHKSLLFLWLIGNEIGDAWTLLLYWRKDSAAASPSFACLAGGRASALQLCCRGQPRRQCPGKVAQDEKAAWKP